MVKHLPPIPNVQEKIRDFVEVGKYVDTTHAKERQKERRITLADALYILKTGRHEKSKTTFDPIWQKWKYAIRGKTRDQEDVRVIVAFEKELMVIITVMYISSLRK